MVLNNREIAYQLMHYIIYFYLEFESLFRAQDRERPSLKSRCENLVRWTGGWRRAL